MSELLHKNEIDPVRREELKKIIDRLSAGESAEKVRKDFHALIKGVDATEVAALEQSLIDGGMPIEEVLQLCEVHASVFKAGLERGEKQEKMPGHPVHTYIEENKVARKKSTALFLASFAGLEKIHRATSELKPIITHYERKENQLFPYLEQTGFTGPSKVMWGKHDEIRTLFKQLDEANERMDTKIAKSRARELSKKIKTMIFMEEKILFPNALKRLSENQWAIVRRGEDSIGFAWVKPGSKWDAALPGIVKKQQEQSSATTEQQKQSFSPEITPLTDIPLDTGSLPLDWLNRILTSLPLDFSFVDAENKVRYYSDNPERVFPRSPGVIGRDVINCHPHGSVDKVVAILEAFRNKEKDKADFWIQLGDKFVYILYKPVYDDKGTYLGTMELSMDASYIRGLEGQQRLLDW